MAFNLPSIWSLALQHLDNAENPEIPHESRLRQLYPHFFSASSHRIFSPQNMELGWIFSELEDFMP